jgi:hypothetical protein
VADMAAVAEVMAEAGTAEVGTIPADIATTATAISAGSFQAQTS